MLEKNLNSAGTQTIPVTFKLVGFLYRQRISDACKDVFICGR